MSEERREEDGYTKFTVALPPEIVQKIDMLKAFSKTPNRNRVIEDAIETLYETITSISFVVATNSGEAGQSAMRIDEVKQKLLDYARIKLEKYWTSLTLEYKKELSRIGR